MADTFYGTGKRKDAIARVWITPGAGTITVNGKPLEDYFPRVALQQMAKASLRVAGEQTFDVKATTIGGGVCGQAGAVRHGIAKALVLYNEEFRGDLRELGALTRDPRVKERKKVGLKRARKAPQYTKR